MATQRGLVLVPQFSWDGEMLSFSFPDPFPMVDLRRYTLYWDRLDFPDNNVINFVESGNNLLEHDAIITLSVSPNTATAIDYLKEADILQRTRVVIERPRELGAHAAFLHAQFEVFRQLEANEPGLWAIGQSAVDFLPPPDTTLPNRTVEIELVKALPTPSDRDSPG